jgi:hypothetical protein
MAVGTDVSVGGDGFVAVGGGIGVTVGSGTAVGVQTWAAAAAGVVVAAGVKDAATVAEGRNASPAVAGTVEGAAGLDCRMPMQPVRSAAHPSKMRRVTPRFLFI